MAYRDEFPDFDFEVPACVTGDWDFADQSWKNDQCPSFVCDVFVLFIDYTDVTKREFPTAPQFSMHCEDEVMLVTNNWEDIRAFVEDGKRHFDEPEDRPAIIVLTEAFDAFVKREGLPQEGDALDLINGAELTPTQHRWLANFIHVWNHCEGSDPQFHAKQPVVEA